jgi:hypothetical protein
MLRFYFNAHADAPLVASVDHGPGTEELKVESIDCRVLCRSVYQPGPQPQFWMECEGVVTRVGNRVIITDLPPVTMLKLDAGQRERLMEAIRNAPDGTIIAIDH